MYALCRIRDTVRVPPKDFSAKLDASVLKMVQEEYEGIVDEDLGVIIAVTGASDIGEGKVVPGDGAAYYNSRFKLVTWKPELQELVFGNITEITNFGAFIDMGVIKGMIHIGQTMEDYVSVSKTNTLSGKNSKRSLKAGDNCMARTVAISHKGNFPKIGLTMSQPGLGKMEWIKEDQAKKERFVKKAARDDEKAGKKGERKNEIFSCFHNK